MIHLLVGLVGTLSLAALSELEGAGAAAPAPWGWLATVTAVPLAMAGLQMVIRRFFRATPVAGMRHLAVDRWVKLSKLFLFVGAYALILWPLGWSRWVLLDLGWQGETFTSLVLLLVPAAALGLWMAPWNHRERRRSFPARFLPPHTFWAWFVSCARFVLVPTGLFLLAAWLASRCEASPWLDELINLHPSMQIAVAAVGLLTIFAISPHLVRLAWPSTPFPRGPLRDRLLELSKTFGVQDPHIRVWNEQTALNINACAVGLFRRTWHVIFTRGICDHLEPGEILAIFAHELGHLRRRHMFTYILLVISYFLSLGPLFQLSTDWPEWLQIVGLFAYSLLYWKVFFGYLSRWLELEADILGAEAAGFEVYTAALGRVAELMGPSAARDGWRHFSMERRLAWIVNGMTNPFLLQAVIRRNQVSRRAISCFLVVAAVAFSWSLHRELSRPEGTLALESAQWLLLEAEELRPLVSSETADQRRPFGWLSRSRDHIRLTYRRELDRARARLEEARAAGMDGDLPELWDELRALSHVLNAPPRPPPSIPQSDAMHDEAPEGGLDPRGSRREPQLSSGEAEKLAPVGSVHE